jgi:hypothetical protein
MEGGMVGGAAEGPATWAEKPGRRKVVELEDVCRVDDDIVLECQRLVPAVRR